MISVRLYQSWGGGKVEVEGNVEIILLVSDSVFSLILQY